MGIPGHGHLIDPALLGGLEVDQRQGFVGFRLLQFGREFTGLGRGGRPGRSGGTGRSRLGVLDHFAIRMHDLDWSRILSLHPAHQHVFKLFGIHLLEQSSEVPLAGHVILSWLVRSWPAAQAAALCLIEAAGKFGNGVRPFVAGDDRQGDEG
jgi:hypothetical protein